MIRGVLLHADGRVTEFTAEGWRDFAETAIRHNDQPMIASPIHKVFGADERSSFPEEHNIHALREALRKGEIPE